MNLVAFQCHGSNVGPMGTLRAGNSGITGGVPAVAITGSVTHALTAEGADAGEDGTGRGTPLVVTALDTAQGGAYDNDAQDGHLIAFAWQAGGNKSASGAFQDDGTTPCLPKSQTLAVAFSENQRGELVTKDTMDSLKTGGGKPGQGYPAVLNETAVRRLTPMECERLQGFPDDWTLIDGTSDSQRYKQMGNSVAVPVFAWVMRRLAGVDAALADRRVA